MPREPSPLDLADEYAERQANRTGCRCAGDMPGRCPGPQSCPMCESAAADADEALNATKVERNDARALRDQVMLQVLLRSSL